MRPDKVKVIDEVWDDERINSFLTKEPLGAEPEDFSRLLHAYRSMRLNDFQIFLERFKAQGGDVHATNTAGETLSDIVKEHRQSADFLALLQA
ncbi:MAG: PA4642 family protein [Gammaproteobacteria bacterium]|jgi:hypothetical protein